MCEVLCDKCGQPWGDGGSIDLRINHRMCAACTEEWRKDEGKGTDMRIPPGGVWIGAAMIRRETIKRLEAFASGGFDLVWRTNPNGKPDDWILPADVHIMLKTLRQSSKANKALLDIIKGLTE